MGALLNGCRQQAHRHVAQQNALAEASTALQHDDAYYVMANQEPHKEGSCAALQDSAPHKTKVL